MSRIVIASPARPDVVTGNAVTAERWRRMLVSLGHEVRVLAQLGRERCDILVALHATKSAKSIQEAAARHDVRIVVALAGTDLYQDLDRLRSPWRSLELADAIVLLQPLGLRDLPPGLERKSVVIRQSAPNPTGSRSKKGRQFFDVVVLSNLRQVKDPLRAAYAARMLPEESHVRVIHGGGALDAGWEKRARAEMRRNPRYVWKGELSPSRARALLVGGDLLVLSSKSEGGANVV